MSGRINHSEVLRVMNSYIASINPEDLDVRPAFKHHFSQLLQTPDKTLACELLDAVWEDINVGHWKDVSIHLRRLYAYVSLILGRIELQLDFDAYSLLYLNPQLRAMLGPISEDELQHGHDLEALLALDRGLVLGCPVGDSDCENWLANAAMLVHSYRDFPPDLTPLIYKHDQIDKSRIISILEIDCLPTTEIDLPTIEYFLTTIKDKEPLKILRLQDSWPARSTWSVHYFVERLGKRTVPVEIGRRYTDDTWTQKMLTIEDFVRNHLYTNNGYLAQYALLEQAPFLRKDIIIPDYCFSTSEKEPEINIWLGGQTVSPLHYDDRDNILCQVFGTKIILLYAPSETDKLYPHPSPLLHNTSQVDVDKVDNLRFPAFREAINRKICLKPGESLYIPKGWWHFVRSMSTSSCSLSFWF